MNGNSSFLLFNDYWPALSILSDEQRGKLMQAFFHEGGADAPMPELDQATQGIFLLIQTRIQENRRRYESKCLTNKANGSKGGRPRNPEKPNGFFRNPLDPDLDPDLLRDSPNGELSPAEAADACEPNFETKQNTVPVPPKDHWPNCPHQQIIDLYHEHLPELPGIRSWNEDRRKHLTTRWRESLGRLKNKGIPCTLENGLDWWIKFFGLVRASPFLMGQVKDWRASLDWLVLPKNFAKTLDEHYVERRSAT